MCRLAMPSVAMPSNAMIARLLMHCRFCAATLRVTNPMDELSLSAATKWGSEDIYMSLVATKVSGLLNKVLAFTDDQIQEMKAGAAKAAISRLPGHYAFRDKFVRLAAQVLKCLKPNQQLLQTY